MEMEGISHRMVSVNGINMHLAEKGNGPIVLLLHGFPELWYSWRHQINGLAAHGFRAVAPDMRGYGGTDAPPSASSYNVFHIVGDLVALIDTLGQDQVYVVGHDWGAYVAWQLGLFRADKVKGLVALSVAFMPRNPAMKTLDLFRTLYGDDHYICRFQEPGVAEADFARTGTATALKRILTLREPGPVIVPKGRSADWHDKPLTLPTWLSEDDIRYYAENFDKTGFTGGFNYYRNIDVNWELAAPWTGAKVTVAAKFIVGELDLTYNSMGIKEYINSGQFKKDVPFLEDAVVMEGAAHFIQQEKPDEITAHILDFIQKH
ncbi:hypothetical protein MRB53_029076 [Persea americana]|uniref:Uncharacterized protein n=1 Tax=Persea americana TaxID=3435 RepID=A0ACC2KHB4_PERAE|nr:hypothetical protein MRB53_029076 [Persea americana]